MLDSDADVTHAHTHTPCPPPTEKKYLACSMHARDGLIERHSKSRRKEGWRNDERSEGRCGVRTDEQRETSLD